MIFQPFPHEKLTPTQSNGQNSSLKPMHTYKTDKSQKTQVVLLKCLMDGRTPSPVPNQTN